MSVGAVLLLRCPDCGVYTDRERGQDERCFHAGHGKPQEARAAVCGVCNGRDRGTTAGPDGSAMPIVCGACEVEELPGDGQRLTEELTERMAVIEKLAGALADPNDDRECDCQGEGIDQEGAEWTLCECVLKRIGDVRDTEREHKSPPIARNGEACDCETPGDWHRVAIGFQRAMFDEHARADGLARHTEILAEALYEFFNDGEYTSVLEKATKPTLEALGYGKGETS